MAFQGHEGSYFFKTSLRTFLNGLFFKVIKIIYSFQISDDGVKSFDRLSTANGELQLMEFPVESKKHQNVALLAALTSGIGRGSDYMNMELKLAEFSMATRPRPAKSYSTGINFTDVIANRVVMCNY